MNMRPEPVESALLSRVDVGFWLYLMSDCLLFASLFAVYAVLHVNTEGGPGPGTLFSLPLAFTETLLLLTSSATIGLAAWASMREKARTALALLCATFALGAGFVYLELSDFASLVHSGNSWQRSGFLSSFFALVGTHGAHVTLGLLWLLALVIAFLYRGATPKNQRQLASLALFWHFLDLVWIFIVSIVYLMGAL